METKSWQQVAMKGMLLVTAVHWFWVQSLGPKHAK